MLFHYLNTTLFCRNNTQRCVFLRMSGYRGVSLKLFCFVSLCWYISRASMKPNLYISERNKSVRDMTHLTKVKAHSLLECAFICTSNINCFHATYDSTTTDCYTETTGSVIPDTVHNIGWIYLHKTGIISSYVGRSVVMNRYCLPFSSPRGVVESVLLLAVVFRVVLINHCRYQYSAGVSCKKQKLLTLRKNMGSSRGFRWSTCCSSLWYSELCLCFIYLCSVSFAHCLQCVDCPFLIGSSVLFQVYLMIQICIKYISRWHTMLRLEELWLIIA